MPHIEFEEGRLDDLQVTPGALGGAVCWCSIMYTPPERLDNAFAELRRPLLVKYNAVVMEKLRGPAVAA